MRFLQYMRHRPVVLVSAVILVLLYTAMIFAPFVAPYKATTMREGFTYHPANVRIVHGKAVAQECRTLNPVSWQYARVKGLYHGVRLFVKGETYKVLWGISCDRHLFGTEADSSGEVYPAYLFGADNLGRDIFSRIVYGSRISLTIGFAASGVSLLLAVLIGGVAGYWGGATDWALMRCAEFCSLIPSLYLILFLRSLLNTQMSTGVSYMIITVILALVGWPGSARTVRGMVHAIKTEDYIADVSLEGVPRLVVIFSHIVPQMASLLIISVALSVPGYIMSETTLSYLGLGISDPAVSWGSLINKDITTLSNLRSFPWLLTPVWLLLLVTLSYGFLADALRDYLDPYHAVFARRWDVRCTMRRAVALVIKHAVRIVSLANIAVICIAATNTVAYMVTSSAHPEWSGARSAAFTVMFRYIIPLLAADTIALILYKAGVLGRIARSVYKGDEYDADEVDNETHGAKAAYLSVENLAVSFPVVRHGTTTIIDAVRGASFTLHKGDTLGIVGESGSGKSVTATAITRLLSASAQVTGRIIFQGQDLLPLTDGEMRLLRGRHIGMIYQESGRAFDPLQSISDAFFESFRVCDGQITRAASNDKAIAALTEVGIDNAAERLNNYPHQFSGGQLQRISIALCLCQGCELLIADEITTALDVSTQAEVIDLLIRLRQARRLTIIFISHNIDAISRIATHIAVMYGGRVMESGRANEVLDRPRHPYTKALLASQPKMGDHYTAGRMGTISGRPYDSEHPPIGCPFLPRCGAANEKCSTEDYICI